MDSATCSIDSVSAVAGFTLKQYLRALKEFDQILNTILTYLSIAPIITISTVFRVVDLLCSGQGEQAKSEFHILNLCLIRNTDLYTDYDSFVLKPDWGRKVSLISLYKGTADLAHSQM